VKIKNLKISLGICIYFGFVCSLIPTIYPSSSNPDRGIFESVSYRLLAQDQLYSEVWDNKDPLFYYLNALTLKISPIADLFLEAGYLFLISVILYKLSRNKTITNETKFLLSFVVVPLIIIQINYFPGYTHLPGEVLFLGIILFIIKEKDALTGVLMGVLLFTKIIFLPIAVFILINLRLKKIIQTKVILKYFVFSITLITFVMILRNELIPWAHSLYLNYLYTLSTPNRFDTFISFFNSKIGIFTILNLAMIMFLNLSKFKVNYRKELLIVNSMAVGTIIVAVFTSKNYHHLQILTPIILITTMFFFQNIYKNRIIFRAAIIFSLTFLLIMSNIFNFRENWSDLSQDYTNDIGKSFGEAALLAEANKGTYARLGQNDDNAHAKGLYAWKLVCPRFHQYPFDDISTFNQTLECIDDVEYLIISPTFKEYAQIPAWNEFVRLAMVKVRQKFQCKSYTANQVCKNSRLDGSGK
jgi:hypothetical protein